MKVDGVIVAADQTLEWILPWWLTNYQKHNHHPVAFIDLGLSFEMKKWCRSKASLITLRMVDFAKKPSDLLKKRWLEESGNQFEEARDAWFKKPFACLKSPFDYTLWIDVDCEIKGSISPLFTFAKKKEGFAIALDYPAKTPYPTYNSGVIVFQKEHPILHKWAKESMTQNHLFRGDQELLSYLIYDQQLKINTIPNLYNWSRLQEENPEVIIEHWHGKIGKFVIQTKSQNI